MTTRQTKRSHPKITSSQESGRRDWPKSWQGGGKGTIQVEKNKGGQKKQKQMWQCDW